MKSVLCLFILLVSCRPAKLAVSCDLVKVKDGDTLAVSCENEIPARTRSIRLMGIDCPESSHNAKCQRDGDCDNDVPKGLKAKARMIELAVGPLRVDFISKDKYGRELGYVYNKSGDDVGLQMLKEGLCKNVSKKYPHPKARIYNDAAR